MPNAVDDEEKSGAVGYLPVEAVDQPSLTALALTDWCSARPCDVTADLTIDLTPAIGAENAPVEIGAIEVTAALTPQTEGDGVAELSIQQILVP